MPNVGAQGGGYLVTEEGEEDDDAFTSINSLQQSYPATYGYLRGAAPQSAAHDPFAVLSPQSTIQTHNPFASAPQPTSAVGGIESFTGIVENDPFASPTPTQGADPSAGTSPELPVNFHRGGFDDLGNSFAGDVGGSSFLSNDISAESPVSFHREAGIQQSYKTGGVETVVY